MGIAAIQSAVETDLLQKADIEFDIGVIDGRRMVLTKKGGAESSEYSDTLVYYNNYKELKEAGQTTEEQDQRWQDFDWNEFEAEYETRQTEIQNQDKELELERTNKQTQLSAVTTEIESLEKQLSTNTEKEFNYAK